jgi:hypothetical protein
VHEETAVVYSSRDTRIMRMSASCLLAVLMAAVASAAEGPEVSIGAIAGVQVLDQTSTQLSRGPVHDEVRLGRTVLGGVSIGFRFRERQDVIIEAVVGPYHNDIDRGCVTGYDPITGRLECETVVRASTRYAVLYGLHYSVLLRRRSPSLFVGFGAGAKTYAYAESDPQSQKATGLALDGAIGLELGGRAPFRVETRFVLLPESPYLVEGADFGGSGRQCELQLRASVRLKLRR